jgi:hypothetical protein
MRNDDFLSAWNNFINIFAPASYLPILGKKNNKRMHFYDPRKNGKPSSFPPFHIPSVSLSSMFFLL